MTTITNIEDLRVLAQKRVPRMFYDYADSGSWTESTYRANEADFQSIKLRQRVAVNMENRSTATTMIGQKVAMPVAIAPTGLTGMQHADGEILAAQARRRKFGIPFTLSTMSICSIEDVAEHAGPGFWFQLYVMKDRAFIERLIDRAKAAGCSALVLTLDLQILGQRHKDLKERAFGAPRNPHWPTSSTWPPRCAGGMGMLGTQRRQFGNIVGHVQGVEDVANLGAWTAQQFDPRPQLERCGVDQKALGGQAHPQRYSGRGRCPSGGAVRCADALIVSNHGGRQLDGARIQSIQRPADASWTR